VIAVEKVEVLTQEAYAIVAGGFVAGVVEGKPQLPGFFIVDLQDGVELVFVGAVLQLQGRLLGRVLVDDAEVLGNLVDQGRLPLLQGRKPGFNVGLAEIQVPLDGNFTDFGFDDLDEDISPLSSCSGRMTVTEL
jgi:hypothetical protein